MRRNYETITVKAKSICSDQQAREPRPYVGEVSQLLAANSVKRRMQYSSEDSSIHTRLHHQ